MRTALIAIFALGCAAPSEGDDTAPLSDGGSDADTDTDTDSDTEDEFDPYEIGRELPAFSMLDINPSSATYGATYDSAALLGQPYALVFLDSRCIGCHDVALDLWAEYEAHDGWWDALPTFAVQSPAGMESPATTEEMLVDMVMPYLADDWDQEIWLNYGALNHDFFVVAEDGTLEAWLPLYVWPASLDSFLEFMQARVEG